MKISQNGQLELSTELGLELIALAKNQILLSIVRLAESRAAEVPLGAEKADAKSSADL